MGELVVPAPPRSGPLTPRTRALLGWAVIALTFLGGVVATVLGGRARLGAQQFLVQEWWAYAAIAVPLVAGAGIAALVIRRVPGNPVGWLLAAFVSVLSVGVVGWAYVSYATSDVPPLLPAPREAAWASFVVTAPSFYLLALVVLLFPDGRPVGARWGYLVPAGLVAAFATTIGNALAPGAFGPLTGVANPYGLGGLLGDAAVALKWGGQIAVIAVMVAAAGSLAVRYRRGEGVERQQVKWVAYAGSLFAATFGVFTLASGPLLARGSAWGALAWLALCGAALLMVTAFGVAILRYRLYDIDLVINRTFVYGALTAILAGLYTASITLSQRAFMALTGERSDAAIVITTLVVAATFTPIKQRLERVASRRFAVAGTAPGVAAAPGAPQLVGSAPEVPHGLAVRLDERELRALADRVAELLAARSDDVKRQERPPPAPRR